MLKSASQCNKGISICNISCYNIIMPLKHDLYSNNQTNYAYGTCDTLSHHWAGTSWCRTNVYADPASISWVSSSSAAVALLDTWTWTVPYSNTTPSVIAVAEKNRYVGKLLSGWNVCRPRSMLPSGESRWVCAVRTSNVKKDGNVCGMGALMLIFLD